MARVWLPRRQCRAVAVEVRERAAESTQKAAKNTTATREKIRRKDSLRSENSSNSEWDFGAFCEIYQFICCCCCCCCCCDKLFYETTATFDDNECKIRDDEIKERPDTIYRVPTIKANYLDDDAVTYQNTHNSSLILEHLCY